MKRICPNPTPWHEAFLRLSNYASAHHCTPPSPPVPLILAGWVYSNDIEKMHRWEETVVWAERNYCSDLISEIPDSDFLYVEKPISYTIGPLDGPMYREWDFEKKTRPSSGQIEQLMEILQSHWSQIVGDEIAANTRPLAFTGGKARRLLILVNAAFTPPWGSWSHLSTKESERRTFTRFRAAINNVIAPHEVDHIDFTTELDTE